VSVSLQRSSFFCVAALCADQTMQTRTDQACTLRTRAWACISTCQYACEPSFCFTGVRHHDFEYIIVWSTHACFWDNLLVQLSKLHRIFGSGLSPHSLICLCMHIFQFRLQTHRTCHVMLVLRTRSEVSSTFGFTPDYEGHGLTSSCFLFMHVSNEAG
jgi:hypothetical protein